MNVAGTFKPLWQLRKHLTLFPLYVLNKTKLMYQYVNRYRNSEEVTKASSLKDCAQGLSQWDRIDFTSEEKAVFRTWVQLSVFLIYYYIGVSTTCRNSFIL